MPASGTLAAQYCGSGKAERVMDAQLSLVRFLSLKVKGMLKRERIDSILGSPKSQRISTIAPVVLTWYS